MHAPDERLSVTVPPHVHIVDDEQLVRASIEFVLESEGIACSAYTDGVEFLESGEAAAGCVLLDVRMPQMSGLEVQAQIAKRRLKVSTIIISGHADVPIAVEAMKLGANAILEKPFTGDELLSTLTAAWNDAQPQLEEQERMQCAFSRVAELSRREKEVLGAVASGLSNLKIADQIGLSVRTVEMHRARMMSRLGADSLAQAIDVWRNAEAFRTRS